MIDLAGLWQEAQQTGWAVGFGSINLVKYQAQTLDWEEVPTRRGESFHSVLRPTTRSAARPMSISAVAGLDDQPLHTDGAHLPIPPDVVILMSKKTSKTPTRICRMRDLTSLGQVDQSALNHGLFVVGSGPSAFLAAVRDSRGYRYDPIIMEPADSRARAVATALGKATEASHDHEWSQDNQVLVINNRVVLHGRVSIRDEDEERIVERLTYYTKDR